MGKIEFLKHFQNNVALKIQSLLNERGQEHLSVSIEDKYLPGTFNGIMDICVFNLDDGNNILAIEIEHLSDYKQALRNIEKMKEWTHRSQNRNCSLLHIFNGNCNISPYKLTNLLFILD